jgi:hypothetical protein
MDEDAIDNIIVLSDRLTPRWPHDCARAAETDDAETPRADRLRAPSFSDQSGPLAW